MKRFLLFGFCLVSLLSACRNEEDEIGPGERPDERLSKVLEDYKSQLVNAEYGWKAILYPEGGAGYSFHFDFHENDRVSMTSDLSSLTASEAKESTYRLKALQQPTLLFDTYSYIHILSDPDETKSGGVRGEGRFSDFEFSFDSVSTDTIKLTGNYNGSEMVLVRATQAELENYIARVSETARAFEQINNFETYFKRLAFTDKAFDITLYPEQRYISFSYPDGNLNKTVTTSYFYTPDGVQLLEPFSGNGVSISSLKGVQFSEGSNRVNLLVNGQSATIQEATSPIKPDLEAPFRFYSRPEGQPYWLSLYGFSTAQELDVYGIRTLPDFNLLVYWPQSGTMEDENGEPIEYDLLGFAFGNQIHYGPIVSPGGTNDGRIIFKYLDSVGEIPEDHLPIVRATTETWTDPDGFYVVQTGQSRYDLVSAKDAKTWITFEY